MPPLPNTFTLAAQPPTTGPAVSLAQLWRVLVDAVRARRSRRAASGHDAGGTLADLDERMLNDIGASQWHAANAAMRSYEDLRTRIDGGLG